MTRFQSPSVRFQWSLPSHARESTFLHIPPSSFLVIPPHSSWFLGFDRRRQRERSTAHRFRCTRTAFHVPPHLTPIFLPNSVPNKNHTVTFYRVTSCKIHEQRVLLAGQEVKRGGSEAQAWRVFVCLFSFSFSLFFVVWSLETRKACSTLYTGV